MNCSDGQKVHYANDAALLLIKSVIASKAELVADEPGRLEPEAANRDGDQENLRLQAPVAMT